jgi:hypothetical protein
VNRTVLFNALLALAVLAPPAVHAAAGSWHTLETLPGRSTVPVVVNGDAKGYFRMTPTQPLVIPVTGPTRIRAIARVEFTAGARGIASFHLRASEGGRLVDEMSEVSNPAKNVTSNGAAVSKSRKLEFDVPAGRHEITLTVDGTSVLLVRLRESGGTEEARMVSLTPVETMRTELLAEGEKTIPYHAVSSGHPLRLRVIGPADVDLSSRLDFDATMRGTVGYRIEVSEAGRKLREYAFKTTKATTASYTNMRDVVPSKLDHFVIAVGSGTHELVFTLIEPAHATAVLHARIPAPTVGNEE